ncbi:FirrV-1-E3 [Feldmannia irregularis virus a]|uniref:FirrV-1-E3 n=1 Tax=Feldmannia irregularis virus a TaxID=231992 RepID=Q6XLV9_9PHYC|nr:FirrV-1-E3 [Feldmannia irregularis virus a]AAR26952.1 FirrV-1-E3 [Feldmannia irregularis virus a]
MPTDDGLMKHTSRMKLLTKPRLSAEEKKKRAKARATKACTLERMELSERLKALVPSANRLSHLNHAGFVKLKKDVNNILSKIRAHCKRCNSNFVVPPPKISTKDTLFVLCPPPANWTIRNHLKYTKPPYTIKILDRENTVFTDRSYDTLKPGAWLDDVVINSYVTLVSDRAQMEGKTVINMDSLFYSVFEKYQNYERVKGFSFDKPTTNKRAKILIPVNVDNNHWILVVVDNRKKTVTAYDSLGVSRRKVTSDIMLWLQKEYRHKKVPFNRAEWTTVTTGQCPTQNNGNDCGIFTLVTAAHIVFKNTSMYPTRDLYKNSRRRIAWSIFNKRLT